MVGLVLPVEMQLLCLVLLLHALVATSATSCRSIREGWLAPIPEIQGAKPNKTSAIKKENILFLLLNMTLLTKSR
jgi:hypothetical protein